MSTLPQTGATELVVGQAVPETTVNEMGYHLDAGHTRSIIEDRDLTAPPGSCSDGARYLVAASPTGAWSGKAGKLAISVGTNAANGWLFQTIAVEGFKLYVRDEDAELVYNGAAWVASDLATLAWKQAVRAATTANGTLAIAYENGDTIDGVTLATGDRILLKNQSAGAENGIYTVNASGAPTRAIDADTGSELIGAATFVSEGTSNADTVWACTTNATITIGSTSLTFAQVGSSGAATASEIWTGTAATKFISPSAMFSAAAAVAVASGATITLDGNAGFNFSTTLGINATLANPSNFKVGQSGVYVITQDGTGSRTLAYGSNWKFPGGSPVLSTATGAIDLLSYYVASAGVILCNLTKAYS